MKDDVINNRINNTIDYFYQEDKEIINGIIYGGYLRDCYHKDEASDIDIMIPKNYQNTFLQEISKLTNFFRLPYIQCGKRIIQVTFIDNGTKDMPDFDVNSLTYCTYYGLSSSVSGESIFNIHHRMQHTERRKWRKKDILLSPNNLQIYHTQIYVLHYLNIMDY